MSERTAWRTALAPYLFLSPFFLLFTVFGLLPLLFSLAMVFMRWDPVGLAAPGHRNYCVRHGVA